VFIYSYHYNTFVNSRKPVLILNP